MNKALLQKGLQRMSVFILCCFIGPFVVHQAFQNEGHPLYYPVLILGLILLALAFFYGFLGIKTLVAALLGERKKRNF
jgi:MFS-type transporter involved in bile tolerance (Atg22 family)